MTDTRTPSRRSIRRVLMLSIMVAMLLTVITFCGGGHLSAEQVRQHTWVPNDCRLDSCLRADISFDIPACRLGDDGTLYEHDTPIARFVGAHYPFIPDAGPRTGGWLRFEETGNGEHCDFHSTD